MTMTMTRALFFTNTRSSGGGTPAGATAGGGHGRSGVVQAGSPAASVGRPALASQARGPAAAASVRRASPRLADSLRLGAILSPMSPAERWHQEVVMAFRCDALRDVLKRRGHP